jgi:hypothetical protein
VLNQVEALYYSHEAMGLFMSFTSSPSLQRLFVPHTKERVYSMPVSKPKHPKSSASMNDAMEQAQREKQQREAQMAAAQAQQYVQQEMPHVNANPNPQQQGQPFQQKPQYQGSFLDLNGILTRPMSRRSTGEITAQYKKKLDELLSNHIKEGFDHTFKILVMDNQEGNTGPLSAILICYHRLVGTEHHCSVYTLLIEGSCELLPPRTYTINGRSVQVETAPSDVYTTGMSNKIALHIQQVHGQPMKVIESGMMVVPRETSYEDDFHMRQIAYVATQAAFTSSSRLGHQDQPVFNLNMINTNDTSLTAKIAYSAQNDFNSGQAETVTGLPVRSDIHISLIGSLNTVDRSQNDLGFEPSRELVSIDGYVDLIYNQPPPPMPGQLPITQHYVPNFVITRADTQIDAITMELQLLALAQATLVSQNWAWAGAFRPNHDITGMDLRDIGAIGYEINLNGGDGGKPKRVDTKASDFDGNALSQFIQMNIHKDVVYSMDVDEGGDLSWINELFLESAYGGAVGSQAAQYIIQAADNLTNNAFSATFQGGPIVSHASNRVHLGYYKEVDGSLHDIRDIDYLAILNLLGKNDLTTVAQWGETFDNDAIPLEIRLETRLNIIKQVMSNNFTLKGYARRILFNPAFLNSLNQACYNAGLIIRPHNMIQEFAQGMSRGSYNMMQYALPSESVHALFTNQPQSYRNSGIGNYQGYFSRHPI